MRGEQVGGWRTERGAARLRRSGELREGSLPSKISLVPAWSHPHSEHSRCEQSPAQGRRGLCWGGRKDSKNRGDKSQGPLASVLGLTTTWHYLPPPMV